MINVKELPSADQVFELHKRYYSPDSKPEEAMSSHWKKFGSDIQADISEDGILTRFKGCGFADFQLVHPLNRILNHICNLSYFMRLPYRRDLLFLAARLRPLLKKAGFYLSYDCFRQLCALATIRRHLKVETTEAFDVLVIGDGPGVFSALLKSVYPNASVTLVDIGKVLFFQAVNLRVLYPKYSHCLFEGSSVAKKRDFLYVPAEDIHRLKGVSYRLAVNMSSMQEMNYGQINDYFSFMRGNLAKDNLFYCCNREKKELPGGEVIEFSKYPWHSGDKHAIDEACPFYKYYLSAPHPFIHRFDGIFRHRLTNLNKAEGIYQAGS